MLSISKLSSSAQASTYYQKADYYTKGEPGEDVKSEWVGEGAKRLGLTGEVGSLAFKDLLDGVLPDGTQVGTTRNGKLEHTPGWDLTFSAPKSLSVLALVSGDKRLVEAHQKAVATMTKIIEERYLVGRKNRGKDGVSHIKLTDMVGGTFTHSTSRDLDPQLHTHLVVMNMGRDENGKDLSLYSKGFYRDKMFLGQVYRNELSVLVQRLGYRVDYDQKRGTFEIAGVDKSILDEFSNRRKTIKEVADLFGYEGGKGLEKAALRSREAKKNVSRESVVGDWEERLKTLGYTPDQLINLSKTADLNDSRAHDLDPTSKEESNNPVSKGDPDVVLQTDDSSATHDRIPGNGSGTTIEDATGENRTSRDDGSRNTPSPPSPTIVERAVHTDYTKIAVEVLSHYESVFTYNDIAAKALKISKGSSTLSDVESAMESLIKNKSLLRSEKDASLYTTHAGVRREHYILDLLELGKGKHTPILAKDKIAIAGSLYDFTDGQSRAFKRLLSSNDRLIGVQGYAGVGKTYMAKPAIELAQKAGYVVRGLAPYGTQVEQLEKDTGLESNTLKSHLMSIENGKYKANQKELWWVDEAGTINAKDMADLLTYAHRQNARVVLSGDRKQLGAIEAGSPFALLMDNGMDTAVNDTIIRQTNPELKQTVYDIIDKRTANAFERLDKRIHQSGSPAIDAVNSYLAKEDGSFNKVALIVPDVKTRNEMNRIVSDHFRDRGDVVGAPERVQNLRASKIDGPMKRYSFFYERGQIVRFHKAFKSMGIEKDEYLTISRVDKEGIILLKKDGSKVTWNPSNMGGGEKSTTTYEATQELYSVGDRIRWKDKTTELGLKNGHIGVIQLIDQNTMKVDFGGEIKIIDLQKNTNRHFELAYAQTVYSVQGQTFQEAVIVAESWRRNLINQASFYVAVSRAKENVSIFTDNAEKLRDGIEERLGNKESAIPNITKEQAERIKRESSFERESMGIDASTNTANSTSTTRDRDRTMDY